MVQDDQTIAADLQTRSSMIWTDRSPETICVRHSKYIARLLPHFLQHYCGTDMPKIIGYDQNWQNAAVRRSWRPFPFLKNNINYFSIEILAWWEDEWNLFSIQLFLTIERTIELFPELINTLSSIPVHDYGFAETQVYYLPELFDGIATESNPPH